MTSSWRPATPSPFGPPSPVAKAVTDRVEKVMALTPAEFAAGLSHLRGVAASESGEYVVQLPGGTATLNFEPLPDVRLGGLLALPRAKISLAFSGCSPEARAAFMRRFDLAFQRGGG